MSHGEIVAEIVRDYKRDGKIGNIRPRDLAHAVEIANAIAYRVKDETRAAKRKRSRKKKR